MLLPLH